MTAVGKKFPDLTINAMNEMGDTFSLNILDQAVNKKKNSSVLVPQRFYFCLSHRITRIPGIIVRVREKKYNRSWCFM